MNRPMILSVSSHSHIAYMHIECSHLVIPMQLPSIAKVLYTNAKLHKSSRETL